MDNKTGVVGSTVSPFLDGLYKQLLKSSLNYFFPSAQIQRRSAPATASTLLRFLDSGSEEVQFDWMGFRYSFLPQHALSEHDHRLLKSIGTVFSTRYELASSQKWAMRSTQLFRGVPEDRYVSAFLDPSPHSSAEAASNHPDRITEAIEVLRTSSMTTYENRRIATGVLLFGNFPDPCHKPPVAPNEALYYSYALTAIRSFHRLCDGLQTIALVDQSGYFAELVDIQEWARDYSDFPLPVPVSARYEWHSRATLCGGHVCLILTPNGEMKVFGDGVQLFRFLDGKWRLTNGQHNYQIWTGALGQTDLAERIFRVALNLAEDRRGALLVVLDDPGLADRIIAPNDMLDHDSTTNATQSSKSQLHYLLRGKRLIDLPSSVLENVARIDGAVVMDANGRVLTFGAILRHNSGPDLAVEGGRTTAAINTSMLGNVLKVSEDGLISYYSKGNCVWEM
jgi:DisA bacterial checkpoint controller nucleotide-binding